MHQIQQPFYRRLLLLPRATVGIINYTNNWRLRWTQKLPTPAGKSRPVAGEGGCVGRQQCAVACNKSIYCRHYSTMGSHLSIGCQCWERRRGLRLLTRLIAMPPFGDADIIKNCGTYNGSLFIVVVVCDCLLLAACLFCRWPIGRVNVFNTRFTMCYTINLAIFAKSVANTDTDTATGGKRATQSLIRYFVCP